MRTHHLLLGSVLMALCLFACKRDAAPVASAPLIVGKWNLQQQTYTQYVDGGPASPVIYTASHADSSYVLFDKNGSYLSATQLIIPTGGAPLVARDTLSGTYTYNPANNAFSVSGGVINSLYPLVASYPGLAGATDYITPLSDSVKITQLTPKLLTLHFEVVENFHHAAGITTNYKTVSDLQYNK